eukprot:1106374-Pyramimonas_sp.AAC.1
MRVYSHDGPVGCHRAPGTCAYVPRRIALRCATQTASRTVAQLHSGAVFAQCWHSGIVVRWHSRTVA